MRATRLNGPAGDGELARRAAAGDGGALRAIFDLHGDALHTLAYRLTGSTADADDVVQDLFVGLPESLRRFNSSGTLRGWLRAVTTRLALQQLRRERRRRESSLDAAPRAAVLPPDTESAALLRRALDALPESLRTVFVLKEVEGYTHAEIAALLDIRVNTAEVRLHRARRTLQKLLGGER